MSLNFQKKLIRLMFCALFAFLCVGTAITCFAEAKAFEYEHVLRGSYCHTMRNEFFIRNANLYNATNQANSWGEVYAREESGKDGSVTKSWMIGDVKRNEKNSFTLNVKRLVVQKLDGSGKTLQHYYRDVDYAIRLYHRMESGVKLEWSRKGMAPYIDIDGEYITSVEYPVMSSEAAIYILQRFMRSIPKYNQMMLGAAMSDLSDPVGEEHCIRVFEQNHPTHMVTRGVFKVSATGQITEYDVVRDCWTELTH